MLLRRQVLIVEDNALNRAILSEILSDEYSVLEAENGQMALDILKQHKDDISLILLDVMMPVMDGYAFLDRLKEDEDLALIPVIVMTQSDREEDEVSALSRGATDFVPKPYRPKVILHRAASLIKLRETAAIVNQFQYDRLTGLYSKEFFFQKVRDLLQKNPEQEYMIVAINIENFKLYNDNFGVPVGDLLLKEMARLLQKGSGEGAICGRFGADRFLCLQERKREQEDGMILSEKHSEYIKNVVMKWGIYEITDRTVTVEQMCDRALLAADSIKGQYNKSFAVYDDTLRSKLQREKNITDAMETALSENQFLIYLQPKYSLNDECMAGTEALVRWIHPEWGFMSPGEFIPLFEKNGFIPRLDQYVWEHVCAQLQDWREKGYPLVPISVNVSRADFYHNDLVGILLGITQKYDVDPAYLHLEITESAFADNLGQIISTVDQLRNLGFVIEMDDFGSGYSSLNMLSQMKLDILKLDMKFIQNEIVKPLHQSILNDIIIMAHRMCLNVVAEGVETKEQMKRLKAVGCDYVQGYYFAKPMPVSEFEELLQVPSQCHSNPQKMLKREDPMFSLLVVDEDAGYRKRIRQTFEGQYHVLEASDAQSALACIAGCEGKGVSAVILSMTLPENGAATLLQGLRQIPAFWKIPVLATIPRIELIGEMPLILETDDFLCKCHPMFDLHRRVERLMELVAAHERENILQDEASRDYLTGLLNRRGLQVALNSIRKEELPLAVCLFDLDNLKRMNDTYGHEAGDRLLKSFADLLRRNTRQGDILCRYGGDEFVVILKHLSDEEIVMRKCENICRGFRDHFSDEKICAACSGGISICKADEIPSTILIERADEALYHAKRRHKGDCCFWNDDIK